MKSKWILVLLASTLLQACGSKGGGGPAPVTEFSDFSSSVVDFESVAHANGQSGLVVDNLIIRFGTVSGATTVAQCVHGGDTNPTITISESRWNALSASQQRAVLFHEMGHCVWAALT